MDFFTPQTISLLIWALGATLTIILSIISLKPRSAYWRGMIGLAAWIFGLLPGIIGLSWFCGQLIHFLIYGNL
jgi:high-affinity K+ transport system ATPase subunit B